MVITTLPVFSDVVIIKQQGMTNPRTLQGDVVSVTAREVLLRISDGTEVPISRDSVLQIIFNKQRLDVPAESEQQALTNPYRSPTLDPDMYSAPVPPHPVNPAPALPNPGYNGPRTVISLVNSNGTVDDETFILLSRFKGVISQATYAGLYNFDHKGTFWVRLPMPMENGGELKFTLFGKLNAGNTGADNHEKFAVKARFIDEDGRLIEESPLIMYEGDGNFNEWFEHLDGISGLGGKHSANMGIPAGTKTIEFRAASASNAERHLVGYMGDVQIIMPTFARQYGQ